LKLGSVVAGPALEPLGVFAARVKDKPAGKFSIQQVAVSPGAFPGARAAGHDDHEVFVGVLQGHYISPKTQNKARQDNRSQPVSLILYS
jgi:hypothetical protein